MSIMYAETEIEKGDFIGDYQVIAYLGRGLFGETFHVQQNGVGKEFALKLIAVDKERDLEWVRKIEAQMALLGNLSSRFIDKVLSCGRIDTSIFIVKDFVDFGGEGPCDFLKFLEKHGGKLSTYQIYSLAKQILQGLIDAQNYEDPHHKGLFHGNLKPRNLLFSLGETEGAFEVKLTDFSPYNIVDARFIIEQKEAFEKSLKRLPESVRKSRYNAFLTSLFTTFDYLPPELLEEKRPTTQGDLFSLGVILYQAISGGLPTPGPLEEEAFQGQEPFFAIVEGLLQADPKLRFRRPVEVLQLLEEVFGETYAKEERTAAAVAIPVAKSSRRSITPPGMVYIPAGEFLIGSEECGADALPQHTCRTQGFYIDRHLVTNQQFSLFVSETGYKSELEERGKGPIWVHGEWEMIPGVCWKAPFGKGISQEYLRHPVVLVTWKDAEAYAHWLGRRLLTEEEWEYAAKGGLKDARFPTGNELSKVHANFSSEGTTPVMHYPPNGYGLYDMAGNVWEWTNSFYEAYPGNLEKNSHFGQTYRVVRGGAWMYDSFHCMVSFRNANLPEEAFPNLGFRTAADFSPQIAEKNS